MADSNSKRLTRDYIIALLGATVIALLIRTFFVEAYRMPSRAMVPAIESGDTLFVSKWGYRESEEAKLNYGDVLVFKFSDEDRIYIKRIVAVPGDVIGIQQGALIINNVPRTTFKNSNELCGMETLPNERAYPVCREPTIFSLDDTLELKPGEYYALSDMRSVSTDLRRTKAGGVVRPEQIIGKAMFIWLSFQPKSNNLPSSDWFQRIRFDRIFKRIQ